MKEKIFKGVAIGFGLSAVILGIIVVIIVVSSNGEFGAKLGERLESKEKQEKLTAEDIRKAEKDEFYDKVDDILTIIDAYYYGDYDREEMYDDMLHAMVDSLGDKYSKYLSPSEMENKTVKANGSFGGVGISMGVYDDGRFYVAAYVKGSPADGKLELEDEIIAIDGVSVEGLTIDEVTELGRGEEGTTVVYTVIRGGKQIDVEMVRDVIVMQYVTSGMIDETIGYIYVSSFTKEGAKQFSEDIDTLKEMGMKELIIDLRDNGGGDFSGCQKMLEKILPQGAELVYTLDKYGKKEYSYDTTMEKLEIPIVVICNEKSASSSEIFIGALKSNKAATIVGTKTFGKGLIQVVKELDDGSGLQLTGWTYFTPDGEAIHGVGITPDILITEEQIANDEGDIFLETAYEVLHPEGDGE